MTPRQVMTKLNDQRNATDNSARAIVEHARLLVPLLKDKGCESVARELEAKLFAYDSRVSEMGDYLKANLESLVDLMVKGAPEREGKGD